MPSPRRPAASPIVPPNGANGVAAPNGHAVNGHAVPKRAGVVGAAQYLQAVERNARKQAQTQSPFNRKALDKLHPPTVVGNAPVRTLAQDEAISDSMAWAMSDAMYSTFAEGTTFLGYSYLSTLAQRAEYRAIVETIAGEMTREWIDFESTGEDDKSDKIAVLRHAVNDKYKLRDLFRKAAIDDGNFGRGHIYVDIDNAGTDEDRDTLKTTIGNGRDAASTSKVGKDTKLKFRTVEPIWCYPQSYNTSNPLSDEWYNPSTWVVMSHEVHKTRLLTMVGREVPDMLKPAYSFGGLALTQMVKPYVDNWLKTRQSVSDLVQAFSVLVLKTVMGTDLMEGSDPFSRADFFNLFRHNNGLLMIDKETEDLANVAAPLGTLDALQAQSQEHMAAVSRIPIVKLLGIQPAGLNASSEGEIRTFYDWIAAYQELLFRDPLETCINFIQLQLWGEIDPHINFKFETLWQLDEAGMAGVEQTKASTHQIYTDLGVVQPEDVRSAVQSDPNSPYHGIELQPLPEPPSPQSMGLMGGNGGMPPLMPPNSPQGPGGGPQAPGGPPGPRAAAPKPKAPSYKPPPSPTHGTQPSVNVAKPGNSGRDRALHPPPYRLRAHDEAIEKGPGADPANTGGGDQIVAGRGSASGHPDYHNVIDGTSPLHSRFPALDAYDPDEKRDESGKWSESGGAGGGSSGPAQSEQPAGPEPAPGGSSGRGAERGAVGRGRAESPESAQASAASAASGHAGLAGLPTKPIKLAEGDYIVPGPFGKAHDAAEQYMKTAGFPYLPPRQYVPVDKERAARIADAFDQMKHDPDDPKVKASYEALAKETLAQWQAIKKTGLHVEWIKPDQDDPYATTPRLGEIDVLRNNHWFGFPTDQGFGTGEEAEAAKHNNPMLQPTDEVIDGRKCVVNDIFRIVHDYFGHFKEGVGFRADGEENAWRSHAAMYSPLARGAMTAETRGQNSWVNYGPYGDTNRKASGADTHYAPQKIGLLPDWVAEEGRRDPDKPAQDAGWNPQAHPRGQPKNRGEFAKGSGAGAGSTKAAATQTPWIQQLAKQNAAPHPGVISRAAHSAVHGISHAAGEFSKEDYETLKEHLAPNSPARQGYGRRILNIATTLPALLVQHFKEQYHEFKGAAGALKALATGHRPAPEQWRGLRKTALTVALAGAMFMMTGEPTGAAAHAAEAAVGPAIQHLATEFGGELVNHTILEHLAKFGAGALRFTITAATGGGQKHAKDAEPVAGYDPDEIQLLQQFITELAHNAVTYPIPDAKLYASLPDAPTPPSPGNGAAPQARDAGWNEAQHPRGQPGNKGEFGPGGGAAKTEAKPAAPFQPIPAAPGTTPIPPGHIRLYHQTTEDRLDSIKREGITLAHAQGIEGPTGVYADPKGFYGKPQDIPTVEFSVPQDRWNLPTVSGGVPPENIIAIHLPWHQIARDIEASPSMLAAVTSGKRDRLLNDATYGPAVQYIKQKYAAQQPTQAHDAIPEAPKKPGSAWHETEHPRAGGKFVKKVHADPQKEDDLTRAAEDAWNEQQHPRGQPKNKGEFAKGGTSGQAKTTAKAPERRDTAPPKLSVGGNTYKAASHADPNGKVTTWAQSVPEAQVPLHEAQHAVSNMAQAYLPPPSANSASDLLRQNYKPVSVEGFLSKQPPAVLAKIRQVESKLAVTPKTSAPVSQGGYMRPDGTWTPERQALHAQIIHRMLSPDVIARATPKPGTQPTFTMIGGRGGSGKSWFTKKGVVDANTFVLDNDAIKQQLKPEYEGWNAALVHEEASDLFDKIDAAARGMGLNIAHDATMRSVDHKKAAAYKAAGYKIKGLYLFVPPNISAQRAINRFMGPEGRYVPPSYILGSTTNESSFDAMKPDFNDWAIYRNDVEGKEPTMVAQSANAPTPRPH